MSVVVLLLLEHGADPDISDIPPIEDLIYPQMCELQRSHMYLRNPELCQSKTAMDYALESKNVHVATYLYLAGMIREPPGYDAIRQV